MNKKREEIMEILSLFGKTGYCYTISLDLINYFMPHVD